MTTQNQRLNLSQNWNLDHLFAGGVASADLNTLLEQTEADLTLEEKAPTSSAAANILLCLQTLQALGDRIDEAEMFAYALRSANPQDDEVQILFGRINAMKTRLSSLEIRFDQIIVDVADDEWQSIITEHDLQDIAFLLQERRRRMHKKLTGPQEQLANDLATDGYHAWGDFRHQLAGRMKFRLAQDGETNEVGLGQIWGTLSHPERTMRTAALDAIDEGFGEQAELFAQTLNALSGFRLTLYRHRGWDSALQEPLDLNQISEATLNAMHDTLESNAPRLVQFLHRKARLLGLEKLSHSDITAPLYSAGGEISYEDAATVILDNFERFSPDMAALARRAFTEGWIDAEDRPGKGLGGQCIPFHLKGESRIHMAFRGGMLDTMVLAHELGHAYHNDAIQDLPFHARQYPMSVAETASTFAEVVIMDALISKVESDDERMRLLAEKLQRVIPFQLLGVFSGFLLEKSLYEERKNGVLSTDRLCELAVTAQKRAYADALDRYHPYQWAMQPHIYATNVPFYNFQYTFGYLFSMGIYAKALQEGPQFADQYRNLLRDAGRMTVEDLAARYLGADLTQPAFWQSALDLVVRDVDQFLALTEKTVCL
jgi:oligoendopeptidase F